ncbi:coiled-coil domain-containing protein 113 isoform X1 [Crotalus tigris]|uniref:coiled-coil domain-containing protein 113 isoform X1 n=1 Tax=Crotalus tigris TaxID=88082 RepID=UPI00192F9B3A|nr:coiled-coil domain-containing protein 113 isoform X1 [Crotalus tigris]
MEPIGENAPLAARALLRLPGGEGRPASCAGPGEAACWPPSLGRVSGTILADEESERDSVHTGESHEGAEELHVELAQLSTEQLLALVEENSHINSMLKIETEMFEKFFNRLEPKDLGAERHGSLLDLGQAPYPRSRRKSKSRLTTDRVICLTVEQKCDLVQRELDETKEGLQLMKENSERTLQNYLAVLEEADIRFVEIKRAMMEFDKDIVKTITKKKGSVIASDKVLRYMEDRIRSRDVMKEKIHLKNDSLKVQKKKMQMQLQQKEELGEALHEVDFQQLKIENAQFLEKIDERNQDLLQLKLTVGNTLQILNFYKRKLYYATAMAAYLVKDIAQRKESLEKIAHEATLVEEERVKAEILNKKLRRQLAEYRVPPVLNYVHEKVAVHDLENTLRIWERKVEIAEMALQSYRNVWHKAKMASHQLQALLPEQERHKATQGH